MTSRERLLTAIRGGTPDRLPVGPFTMGRIDPDSDIGRELIERTDVLIDAGSGADPFLGAGVPTTAEHSEDTTTITWETPKGPLTQRIRRTQATSAHVEYPLKTREDVERFFSIPYREPEIDLAGFHSWQERIGDNGLVLAGIGNAACLPASWFSPGDFCMAWAESPELVIRLAGIASERLNVYVERLCRAGVDGFRIIGGEYVTVQLGPRAFRELLTPFDTPLVEIMHRHGAVAYYHNHGPIMRWLPALADLGIDALDPLEAAPWGDCDLRGARRLVPEALCFVGNLDDMEVIDALPEEEVVSLALQRAEEAGPRAFVLGGTASGTFGVRGARNFMAMAGIEPRRALEGGL